MSASDDTTNEPVLRFITKDKSGPGYYDGNDPAIVRALAIAAVVDGCANLTSDEWVALRRRLRVFLPATFCAEIVVEAEARIAKPAPQDVAVAQTEDSATIAAREEPFAVTRIAPPDDGHKAGLYPQGSRVTRDHNTGEVVGVTHPLRESQSQSVVQAEEQCAYICQNGRICGRKRRSSAHMQYGHTFVPPDQRPENGGK